MPADHYVPNPRGPIVTPEPSYPEGTETSKVHHQGAISFRNGIIYLAKALAGETVLLEPADEQQRFYNVYFLDIHIGTIDSLYGTTKDVTLCTRGNVTHETGHIRDWALSDEFSPNSTEGNTLTSSPM